MKSGEKYYCIKDRFHDFDDSSSQIINKRGKLYEIKMFNSNIDSNTVWLDNEQHKGGIFYLLKEDINGHHYIFDDYFITLKESRVLKLNKINNIE